MSRIFVLAFLPGPMAVGLLALRVVMGAALLFHGLHKIESPHGPFGWMGPGSGVPGVLQGLAVLAEFGGGLALLLGLLTPLAAIGIACTMIAALALVHLPHHDPFVGQPGKPSAELAAVYLAGAILFLLVGPGTLSIDRSLFRRFLPGSRNASPRSSAVG